MYLCCFNPPDARPPWFQSHESTLRLLALILNPSLTPLALINESPTFLEGEKGFGWGPVHSIPDENSNWGDFAAGCVDMLWHGMVWHGCMCVGVGVLELAKSCPSPHGASKASLHTPFLTNNRTLSSYLLSTFRSNNFYQFLILLLLFHPTILNWKNMLVEWMFLWFYTPWWLKGPWVGNILQWINSWPDKLQTDCLTKSLAEHIPSWSI